MYSKPFVILVKDLFLPYEHCIFFGPWGNPAPELLWLTKDEVISARVIALVIQEYKPSSPGSECCWREIFLALLVDRKLDVEGSENARHRQPHSGFCEEPSGA